MMTQMEAALNGSLKRVRMLCFIFDVNHLNFYKIQVHTSAYDSRRQIEIELQGSEYNCVKNSGY